MHFLDFSPCAFSFVSQNLICVRKGACGYIVHVVTFVCLFASMCHFVFLQLLCLCVCAITLVKLVRLLAIVRHHVNLQCLRESGGSVIVLFAAVWLSSDMLPNLVPS